jgi:heme exporter protein A
LFRDLSFVVEAGTLALVTGPNGSGKTTLLRALAGLTRPESGTITWSDAASGLAESRAYLGHAAGWKDTLSVTENLHLAWQLDAEPAARDAGATLAALEQVGLARQRNLALARLSQGQKKRLHLARLSRSTRPLWLLDEPSAALDDQGLSLLTELVGAHLLRGGMAAIATHQQLEVTAGRTQNVALSG